MRVASLCGAVLVLISSLALGQNQPRPLNQNEIIALVAGAALPENVVAAIQQRGVNFALQPANEQTLRDLGGCAEVIKAIKAAKFLPGEGKTAIPELNDTLIQAKRLMKERKFAEAAEYLSAAASKHPGASELAFVMAQVLLYKREGLPSAILYRALLERDPAFPEAHTRLGFAYMLISEYDDGIAEEKAVLEQNPQNAQAHRILADLLEKKGKHDAAIAEFQQAIKIKPDYGPAYFGLAVIYGALHDDEQSLAMYRKTLALEADNPDDHFYYAEELKAAAKRKSFVEGVQQRMQAVEEYRMAKRLAPERADIRNNLGNMLLNTQRNEDAEKEYRDLIKVAPDFALGHSGLGRALLREEKNLKEAEAEFGQAIKLDPTEPGFYCGLG